MVQFNYVQPTEQQKELMQLYRDRFEVLYVDVLGLESNRVLSLALTKLEEASMWLNKSITNNC
jgi:hypothetical protein